MMTLINDTIPFLPCSVVVVQFDQLRETKYTLHPRVELCSADLLPPEPLLIRWAICVLRGACKRGPILTR